MTDNQLKASLVALLKERSLRVGDFTLASGRKSRYYVDARRTTMSALGMDFIGRLGLASIRANSWNAHAVGGLTLGADPVAYAIALASTHMRPLVDAFTVRKEAKDHGTARLIEGCFEAGMHVVVVEDVITTGSSALKAVAAVKAAGGTVSGVLGVVDREEGGIAAVREAGIPVTALVSIRDLGVNPT